MDKAFVVEGVSGMASYLSESRLNSIIKLLKVNNKIHVTCSFTARVQIKCVLSASLAFKFRLFFSEIRICRSLSAKTQTRNKIKTYATCFACLLVLWVLSFAWILYFNIIFLNIMEYRLCFCCYLSTSLLHKRSMCE